MKKGLDQIGAWLLALVITGAVFSAVYMVSKSVAKHHADDDELSESDASHGESHDDQRSDEHGDVQGEGASEHKAEHESGHESEPAKDDHGSNAEKADSHGNDEHELASPAWTYRGSDGPEAWGGISEQYARCKSGKQQSPIDIETTSPSSKLLPLKVHYRADDLEIKRTSQMVTVEVPKGQYVEIDGERFDLENVQFHTPSEHKIVGAPYDMEIQLLHRNAAGQRAIIAVLLEEGKSSPVIDRLWNVFPNAPGRRADVRFDPTTLLPSKLNYYHYTGSITTPPCSENVRWFVMTTPMALSAKQVDQYVNLVQFNARPVQALHGRRILKSLR